MSLSACRRPAGTERVRLLAGRGAGGRATVSDAFGRILVEADATEDAAVDAKVPLAAATTVYSRLGDWFGWCCVAVTAPDHGVALT
jgi:hypothetical protein